MVEYEDMDGPVAGETAVDPTPEEPKVETPADPPAEETPEQIEEKKRLTGSARQKAKAERLAEENKQLQDRLARLEARLDPQPATKVDEPGKPKVDDYETHEAWVEAVADWKVDRKLAQREEKERSAKAQESWLEQAEKAKAKYDDFNEALESAPNPSSAVIKVIQRSPVGADLAYHLATHETEFKRINAMAPEDAAYELGQLALKFSAPQTEPKPKPQTKAPAPVVPLTPSAMSAPKVESRYEEF